MLSKAIQVPSLYRVPCTSRDGHGERGSLYNGKERGRKKEVLWMKAEKKRCSLQKLTMMADLHCIKRLIICQMPFKSNHVCGASYQHFSAPEPESDHSENRWIVITKNLDAFRRFSRPHTIIGTIVGIVSVSLLTIESVSDLSPIFFVGMFKALFSAICMNIYVVGLNQLFDVEIDKVNKPYLPLASGEFSVETGIMIVAIFCVMSFSIGLRSQSPPLLCALVISFSLGSAYSIDLPFLRWKQHAFLAASCILCVRAILLQLAFFLHMQMYVLGRQAKLAKSVIFATIFMCFFSAVIALFKDIPDVDGDRYFGIESFSVRLGQERIFWLCIKLLLSAYGIAMLVGSSASNILQRLVTVLGHGLLASILWSHAQFVDMRSKASITSFYMFIWKLFYTEYLLIPFVK